MGRSLLTRFYFFAGVLLFLVLFSWYAISQSLGDFERANDQEDYIDELHRDLFMMGFYIETIEAEGRDDATIFALNQSLQAATQNLTGLNRDPLPDAEYQNELKELTRSYNLLKTFAQGFTSTSRPETEEVDTNFLHSTLTQLDEQLDALDEVVETERDEIRDRAGLALGGALLLYLVLLVGLGLWLYQILRRIRTMQEAADKLADGRLETRLPVTSKDEIGNISETFNLMAERVGGRVESLLSDIRQRTKALEASQRITLAASERLSPDDLLSLIVNLIRDQFGLYHVQVYLVDEEKQAAILRDSTGYAGRQLLQREHQIPLEQTALVTQAIHQRKSVLVADVKKEPTFLPNPLLPDTRAELVMPMIVENRVIGALDIQSSEHGSFTPAMVALFESLTKQISLLFENSDLVTRVSRQSDALVLFANQLRTASELAGEINSFLDLDHLLTRTVGLLQERFNLYQAQIFLLDNEGQQLVMRAGSGDAGEKIREEGFIIPLTQERSLIARAARTQEIVLVEDVHQEPSYLPHPLMPETHSEVTIPLVTGNRVLGVLDVQATRDHVLTQADLDVFKTLAGQIASALENARLFEQVERNLEEARIRYEASQALSALQSEDEVLSALLEQASLYPDTLTTLFLMEQQPGQVTLITYGSNANGEGLAPLPEGTRFDSTSLPTVKYLASPEPFMTQSATEDERFDPAALEVLRATGSVSIAALPIFIDQEQVAALIVSSPEAGYFDSRKVFLYQTLAEQGGIALRAARLRAATELARAEAELERNLLDGILNNLPVGVYVTDTKMHRLRVNELADRLFERGPGQHNIAFNFIHADTGEPYPEEFRPLSRTLQDGLPHQAADIAVRFEDGRLVNLLVNSGPLLDTSGKMMGAITALSDITAHKRAEEALAAANEQLQEELIKRQQTEDRFRAIAEAIPLPIVITQTATGVVQYANQHISTMFSLAPDEVIGQASPNFYQHPTDRKHMIDELARKGYLQDYEVPLLKADGTPFWAAVSIQPLIFDEQRSLLAAFYDLTERREAEAALRVSEERFRSLIQNSSDVITILAADGTILYESPSVERILGYQPEELVGQNAFAFTHPDDVDAVVAAFSETVEANNEEEKQFIEFRYRHKDGSWRLLEAIGTSLLDNPSIQGIVVNSRDITERRAAEQELRESEERLRTVTTNVSVILFAIDTNGIFTLSQGKGLEKLGLQPGQVVGLSAYEVYKEYPEVLKGIDRALTGESFVSSVEVQGLVFETQFSSLRNDAGEITGVIGVSTDITERRRAADALREQRAFLRQIVDAIPNPVFVKDWDGRYLLANQELANMIGGVPEDILHKTDSELFPGFPDAEAFIQADREVMSSLKPKFIPEEQAPDVRTNEPRWFQTIKVPLTAADGKSNQVLGVATDITARKRAEQALAIRLRYEEGLAACSQALLASENFDDAMNRALTALLEAANVNRAYVFEQFAIPEEGSFLRQTHEACKPGTEPQIDNPELQAVPIVGGFAEWMEKVAAGQPVGQLTSEFPADVRENLEPQGIQSILTIPISVGREWYGLIGFDDTETAREWGEGEIRLLQTASDMLGNYIERKRAEQALAIRLRYEEGLAACSQALLTGEDFDDAMNQALAALLQAANVNRAYVFEQFAIPEEGSFLRQPYEVCKPGTTPQIDNPEMQKLPIEGSLAEWMEQLAGGYAVGGPVTKFAPDLREMLESQDIRSLLTLPIFLGREWYGVVGFDDTERAHEWGEEEIRLLQTASDMLGNYIERKRAEEALAERARLATFDAEVSQALTESKNLQHVLQRCTQAMVDHLDAAFARIWTLNPRENVLELQASAGMYTHLDGPHARVPVGMFKIGLIAEEKRSHLTNSVQTDPRVGDKEWAKREGMVAFAGHPLILDGEVIGVMAMFAREPLTEFTSTALASTASTIALGIERKRAEEAQARLTAILDATPDFVGIANVGGQPLYMNRAGAEMVGHTVEEVLSHPSLGDFHPAWAENLIGTQGIPTAIREGTWSGESALLTKDGREIPVSQVVISHKAADGTVTFLSTVARDITEQKRAAAELQQFADQLRTAAEAAAQINAILDPDELLQHTTTLLQERFDLYHAHIYLLDEIQRVLVMRVGSGEVGQQLRQQGHSISVDQERSLVARAARTQEVVLVDDVQAEPGFLPNPLLPNTRSEVAIPLVAAGRVLGVVDLQDDQAQRFTPADLDVFRTLASQVATALENARLFEQVEQNLIEAKIRFEVSQALAATQTEEDALDTILERAGFYPKAQVSLYLFDPEAEERTFVVYDARSFKSNLKPLSKGVRFPVSQFPLIEQLVSADDILVSDNVFNDGRFDEPMRDVLRGTGAVSGAIIPLTMGDEWIGIISATSREEGYFDEQKLFLYRLLTTQGAVAVRAARLRTAREQARAETERERSLLNGILTNLPVGVYVTDRAGAALRVNEKAVQLLGRGIGGDLEGGYTETYDVIRRDNGQPYPEQRLPLVKTLTDGGHYSADDLAVRQPDGTVVNLLVNSGPVLDPAGEMLGAIVAFSDITERVQAEESLTRFTNQLRTAAELTSQINAILDPNELLQQTVNLLKERFDLYHVHVYLLDEMSGQLLIRAGSGEVGRLLRERGHALSIDREQSLVARAARTREVVLVDDVRKDPNFLPNPLLPDTYTEVAVPLLAGGKVLGVFDVQDDEANRFGPSDMDVFRTLAGQVATALENARLFEEVQKSLEETAIRFQVSQALAGTQTEEDVLDALMEQAGFYPEAQIILSLLDTQTEELAFVTTRTDSFESDLMPLPLGLRFTPDSMPLLRHLSLEHPLIVTDVFEDPRFDEQARELTRMVGNRSTMVVPIVAAGEWFGNVVASSREVGYFDDYRRQFLYRSLAEQGAVALRTARLFDETQRTAERLRELDRLKSEFLANMSHELRTPLNSIIGYAEILLMGINGELNEDAQEDVQAIRSSGQHLLRLINDILDLAKIEAGRMTLEWESVTIPVILDEVRNNNISLIHNKPIELIVEVQEDLPPVRADSLRLNQILTNLLSNAIKFTNQGQVWLRAYQDNGNIALEVRDTGIGMSEHDLETIFEEFRQVDGSSTRRAEGTGLGLAITRHLVQMHGGHIAVESRLGGGSTFTVTLPCPEAPES